MSGRRRVWPLNLSILLAASAVFLLLSLLSASSTVASGPAQAGPASCLTTDTLEELIGCILPYMPHSYSRDGRDGFDVPTVTEMIQWRDVVGRMMEGECDTISLSDYDWGSHFTVTTFTDTQNSNTYCVFIETAYETYPCGPRVTHGWGTFIHNPTYSRQINISAPHARYELGTAVEAVGIFKNTRSHTFLMTGAHRHASNVDSDCQGEYKRSDAAHNTDHMLHATVEELMEYYDSRNCKFYHLQFHGMSSCCGNCDVHLSHGSSQPSKPGDKILELRDRLLEDHPSWRICVPGDGSCGLNGTKNVQGRLLNGVPSDQVCDTAAPDYSGYFIHIEQCRGYRDPDDWFPAVNDTTWPVCYSHLPLVMKNSLATGFEYGVQGCLSSTTATDELVEIYVEDNDVVMHHYDAIYNCCAVIVVDFVDERPLLKLVERETYPGGYPCTCTCPYDISARILDLPSGSYRVEVWNAAQSRRYGWAEVTVP